jgi:hypothetical protein
LKPRKETPVVRTADLLRARSWLAALLLLCAGTAFAFVESEPPTVPGPPRERSESPPIRLDEVKLPSSDAILVICERAAEALRVLPKYYYAVPPKEYDALLAKIDQLNKQLQARQPAPVSKVELTGQVKANRVDLTATFSFTTDADSRTVALGCRQAIPWSILLDDAVPRMRNSATEGGLFVEVDKAGPHTVTVKMLLALREVIPRDEESGNSKSQFPPPKANSRSSVGFGLWELGFPDLRPLPPGTEPLEGFDLDLPLAPTTNLTGLELPEGARSVEVNDQPPGAFVQVEKNQVSASLGKVKGLKVAWKNPAPTAATPVALASSRGKIVVTLHPETVSTKAELTLVDLGLSVRDWKLQLPEGAEVELVHRADRDRLRGPIQGNRSKEGVVTLPLKAASALPLTVALSVTQSRGTGPLALGPFAAVGATSQSGTVWVIAEGRPAIHCLPFASGPGTPPLATMPRRLDRFEEGNRPPPEVDAAFQYWSLPGEQRLEARDPWFRLEVDPIQGILGARLEHTLTLSREGGWHLKTVVNAFPLRAGVDQVEIEWPLSWQPDPDRKPEGAASFDHDAGRRLTRLKPMSESLEPYRFVLEFRPEGPPPGQASPFPPAPDVPDGAGVSSAVLKLPRPRGPTDRGDHVLVVEARDLDLRVQQPANPALELGKQEAHRLEWRAERFPTQVAVAWRPYRPEVHVDSDIDMTLTGSEVQVTHHLQMNFPASDKIPASVLLRVPAGVDALTAGNGPLESAEAPGKGDRTVPCPFGTPAPAGRARRLTLEYRVRLAGPRPLPREGGDRAPADVAIPLVSTTEATHGQVRVNVWAAPGVRVRAVGGTWQTEDKRVPVAGRSWQTLVLRSQHPSPPLLTLHCDAPLTPEGTPTVQVKRCLVQVKVAESGSQQYRVLFLLRLAPEASSRTLDVAFPKPLTRLAAPQLFLDGKVLSDWEVVATEGRRDESRLVRVHLPSGREGKATVLEVGYHLNLSVGWTAEDGPLRTTFQPVTLPGLLTGVPTRWQVEFPPGWVPLSLEGGPVSLRWGWRGWLLASRPASTSPDLLDWLRGDEEGVAPLSDDLGVVPAFDCWRGEPATLSLYHVPQQAWLLVCSLGLLALGLGLYLVPLGGRTEPALGGPPNRLFWPMGALFGLTVAAVGLVWPGLLGAILYGCQPGMVVLLVVLAVQWLVRERYRRRVVFLPGFRRLKTGSSLVRTGSSSGGSGRDAASSREPAPLPVSSQEAANAPARSQASVPKARGEPSTVDQPAPEGSEGV